MLQPDPSRICEVIMSRSVHILKKSKLFYATHWCLWKLLKLLWYTMLSPPDSVGTFDKKVGTKVCRDKKREKFWDNEILLRRLKKYFLKNLHFSVHAMLKCVSIWPPKYPIHSVVKFQSWALSTNLRSKKGNEGGRNLREDCHKYSANAE